MVAERRICHPETQLQYKCCVTEKEMLSQKDGQESGSVGYWNTDIDTLRIIPKKISEERLDAVHVRVYKRACESNKKSVADTDGRDSALLKGSKAQKAMISYHCAGFRSLNKMFYSRVHEVESLIWHFLRENGHHYEEKDLIPPARSVRSFLEAQTTEHA
ncbi:unnamed protein product [Haemonchus placei]|uniref:MRG domain-containing protein n=1 Tax=Haemonchus placei TaxID=6290 RepID=A0A0N4WF57_HAEPC|nr:unnamed protein product [Haemonchus placei]